MNSNACEDLRENVNLTAAASANEMESEKKKQETEELGNALAMSMKPMSPMKRMLSAMMDSGPSHEQRQRQWYRYTSLETEMGRNRPGPDEMDLFSGMRALGAIGNASNQFMNPIREPRWAHEQRLLDLMDENTALAMFTAYSDEDSWINGEKSLCGSLLPKFYYQQEIERTVHQWIEDERKHVERVSRSSSMNSERSSSSSSSSSIFQYEYSALSSSTVPAAPSFADHSSISSLHCTSNSSMMDAARRRASVSTSSTSSFLPELSTVGNSSRAVSVPTAKRSIQDSR